jgi:hypothetical protein
MGIRADIVINQGIERVFQETTREENFARWNPDILEPRWISGSPNTIGSRFEAKMRGFRGRTHPLLYEVVEFDPPRRHSVRLMSPPFCFKGIIELRQLSEGRTLLMNWIEPDWSFPVIAVLMSLATPTLYLPMRYQMRRVLSLIKRDIEAKYSG